MIFNPLSKRRYFDEGGLDFILHTRLEEGRPMGNVAQHEISNVIGAWLTGLHAEIAPVLPRSLQWLGSAISKGEDFGTSKTFHQMTLAWARALGEWMLEGKDNAEAWNDVRRLSAAALLEGDSFDAKSVAGERLDDYMAFCYQAEAYEVGVAEFEQYNGKAAPTLGRIQKPGQLGYALCLDKIQRRFEGEALFQAGRKVLQMHLEGEWLGRGQAIRAATWLKIVYGHHVPSLTPLQTILAAYESMPRVRRPEFA